MTTVPKRLAVKFNLKNTPSIQPKDIVPIFQRWIQEHTVEGMLIDVIDYKHVADGPGVILIADEGDYGYDLGDGEVGLQYIRKRALPENLSDALRLVIRLAYIASQRLEDEGLEGVTFDYSSAKITFLDRKSYRNQPSAFDAVQSELVEFLTGLYGDEVSVTRAYDDPRELFAVRYSIANDLNVNTLETNLNIVANAIS